MRDGRVLQQQWCQQQRTTRREFVPTDVNQGARKASNDPIEGCETARIRVRGAAHEFRSQEACYIFRVPPRFCVDN